MSMINSYCVDEITVLKWEGTDSWGEPESGSSVELKGYVEWKTRLVRDRKGEEVVSSVTVYLPKRKTDAALGRPLLHEDSIMINVSSIPAATYGNIAIAGRAIIDIRMPKDFSRPHYEVYLA